MLDLYYLGLNWNQAPFNDPLGRQAFALAIDKKALADDVLHSTTIATNHIVPDGMPGDSAALKGPDGTTNLTGNADGGPAGGAELRGEELQRQTLEMSACRADHPQRPPGSLERGAGDACGVEAGVAGLADQRHHRRSKYPVRPARGAAVAILAARLVRRLS